MVLVRNSAPGMRSGASAVLILVLVLGSGMPPNPAHAAAAPLSEVVLSNRDPQGAGESVFTVLYQGFPQQAQVGTTLVIPVKLYVDNLTKLMSFLQDYNVTVTLTLQTGKSISGKAGVSANQAAENLGALQLHAGQLWGPANITLPVTEANTGLAPGREAVANATIRVDADVWFNQPINFYRTQSNQTSIGEVVIANGTPSGPVLNYGGFGLLGLGVVLFVVALVTRSKKPSAPEGRREAEKKAPGAV
jgi:hypothetical protein